MAKNLTKHQRRLKAPRFADTPVKTAFLPQHRGSLGLRLPNGKVKLFRDSAHRSAAVSALSGGRFETLADLVACAQVQPNGFSQFLPTYEDRPTRLR